MITSTRRVPPECLSPQAKISAKMNNFIAAFEAQDVAPEAHPLMLDVNATSRKARARTSCSCATAGSACRTEVAPS